MFDARDEGVTDLQKNVVYLISSMPKESRTVLRRVGTKARTIVAQVARKTVKKKTGTYFKKFKRGKVWEEDGGVYKVRVYNNAPHAHLIENGHRIVTKDGREVGFAKGYKVMQRAEKELESTWDDILEKEIDRLIGKM